MTAQKSILIVEDDPAVVFSLQEILAADSVELFTAGSGAEALALLKHTPVDLVIIDIGLPDISGLEIIKSLGNERHFGIIILTGLRDTIDVVVGLELGADDYIVKPFEPRELLARVRSVMRRFSLLRDPSSREPGHRVEFRGWSFDPATRSVRRSGERAVKLTASENRLLKIFIENPNQILTRDRILDLLHPANSDIPFDRSIDVTVTRLRRKIEQNARRPRFIRTAHGDGYLFDPKGE